MVSSNIKIMVCGIGAIGSNLVDSLARQGFRKILVLDKDRVERRNISTQIYGENQIGYLKTQALKTTIFRNTGIEIDTICKELTATNSKLLKQVHLVVDAFDNSASRKLVQDACRLHNIKCIHVGLSSGYGEVCWDEKYRVPNDVGRDVCEDQFSRNLISITVAVASEEIIDFCISNKPRIGNWTITLKDLVISRLNV